MPIYEYACNHCGHSFDELQKISEAALVHCPKCNEPALRKMISAPKFRLKGKGWYETDFKTGDKRNLHGDSDSKSKDDASGKTDKKSADKKSTDKKSASTSTDSKASTT